MTIIVDRPTVTDPCTLVEPGLFDRLVSRIRVDHPELGEVAEPIMEQALAFLATCAANPGADLGPSEQVDVGWHTFILYTRDYAAFCQRTAGRFIHHTPDDVPSGGLGESKTGPGLAATIEAMRAAGYRVDPVVWPDSAADCTSKCHQCYSGCYASPEKAVG
ncbi:glycine-rich domain-containing protein [Streptosporangium carneum]|uniref:Uncharacterized protein n=1 Tax=Streptosporangium carneum TaxID=47481 RepID=A0A9W6I5R0_9ACTN|nr:hypothetical protein [Streptosporangium carneum]GLK12202.1 hypothetical protein GCM10017600_56110 [Streptosporangium carneum]